MGGAVSAGENNDELIDNLVEANYIRSKSIEDIFRAVDRGNYYLRDHRETAYHDLAWKFEHIHISAPCIYSEVMGALHLEAGQSFLNIGSGTGYLSTMAGLILEINGINHGIEVHADVVDYANTKVQEFILQSHAFDRYSFCEPEFVVGNCLNLSPDTPGYDRIYCGAACPSEYESFIKNLLNVDGVLVMPLEDQLQVIRRTGQATWESKNILAVNFANLVVPIDADNQTPPKMPERNPMSLMSLCRACIRHTISTKYHTGSNRMHKKKRKPALSDEDRSDRSHTKSSSPSSSLSSDDSDNSAPDLVSDEENDPVVTEQDDADSMSREQPKPNSSILNVAAATVITIGDGDREGTSSASASSLVVESSSASRNSPSSAQRAEKMDESPSQKEMDVDPAEGEGRKGSTGSPPKKRKDKSDKDRRPSSSSRSGTNGKLKRSKRGCYPFFRRRRKNRKTEAENREMVPYEESNSSNPNDDTESENKSSSVDPTARQGETRRTTNVNIHVSSDSATLRSFLMGMNSRGPTGPNETHRDRLFSFLTDRASRHQNVASLLFGDNDPADDTGPTFEKEENYSQKMFRAALLRLPVPQALKRYLMFYREQ